MYRQRLYGVNVSLIVIKALVALGYTKVVSEGCASWYKTYKVLKLKFIF